MFLSTYVAFALSFLIDFKRSRRRFKQIVTLVFHIQLETTKWKLLFQEIASKAQSHTKTTTFYNHPNIFAYIFSQLYGNAFSSIK